MIRAIVAVAENGVIGDGMKIPWHISDDFKHFKRTTLGGILVMGRRTWESIGSKPLPNRENAVITSHPNSVSGARAFTSLESCLQFYSSDPRDIWIMGGARLYKSALGVCEEIIVSRVKLSPHGDVFFPNIDGMFKKSETILTHTEFDVVRYTREK